MNDAYRIQSGIMAHKLEAGRQVIGWKIGLTSKAMQQALNIDIPDSGILFDDMAFDNNCTIEPGRFIQPRIEAEIAFVMNKQIGGEHVTRDDVVNAVDYVTPAIEILDTRIVRKDKETGQSRNVNDTISDNAANAGIVVGNERHTLNAHDLRWVGAIVSLNGSVEETGLGAGVLNDPVESVLWLIQRMAQYGQHVEPGHVILSGSFIRPLECPPGSSIDADFGAFGRVCVNFD
ncbi:UNVERIFIED_CONTAM: hypothetical protein GTU68_029336 [Idotea baltica]|nr:hypothetical protein [Idotea baltica]